MSDLQKAIEFSDVSFTLPDGKTLLSDLNLSVEQGETLVLLGRSGSGKTTTMKLINRLIDPIAQLEDAVPLFVRVGFGDARVFVNARHFHFVFEFDFRDAHAAGDWRGGLRIGRCRDRNVPFTCEQARMLNVITWAMRCPKS